jgi:hypothetical protein
MSNLKAASQFALTVAWLCLVAQVAAILYFRWRLDNYHEDYAALLLLPIIPIAGSIGFAFACFARWQRIRSSTLAMIANLPGLLLFGYVIAKAISYAR